MRTLILTLLALIAATPADALTCVDLPIGTGTTEGYLAHPGGISWVTLEPDTTGDATGTVVELFVGCTAESASTCPSERYCWNDKDGDEHCELDGDAASKGRGTAIPGAGYTRVSVTSNGAAVGVTPVVQICRMGN